MDDQRGAWSDCEACRGTGTSPVYFPGDYFDTLVGCPHCSGTGLGLWVEADDDDGDTRAADSPYDYQAGRAAA